MRIKKVEIVPIKPHEGLVAFATIEIDEIFMGAIAVYKRRDGRGFRVVYPTRRLGNQRMKNVNFWI